MKATKIMSALSKILFCAGLFFTCVCFVDTWRMPFFLNSHYRFIKYVLTFVVPAVVTVVYYIINRELRFVGKASAVIMAAFIVCYIADSLTIKYISCFGSFVIIFHLSYGLISVFTVLLCATLIKLLHGRDKHIGYRSFYNDFFLGFAFMLAFIFVLIYFVIRSYSNDTSSLNLALFRGELYDTFVRPNRYILVRTAGNVLFYTAMALTITRFFKRGEVALAIVIPSLVSLASEALQYLLQCGDCDIDDFVTNLFGALVGALIYRLIIKNLVREVESE